MEIVPLNTGLTDEQVLSAFTKALASASAAELAALAAVVTKITTAGKEIPANGDIHDCTEVGYYYCSAANSRTVAQLPVEINADISFSVKVEPVVGTNRKLRRFTFNIGTTSFAFRIWYQWVTSSGVSDWYEVSLTQIPASA